MKKLAKRTVLSTLISSFALCSVFAVANLTNASANTQVTIDTVSSFEMMKGASVRLVESEPGIRFSATMSVDEYQGLVATYGAENLEFGTFIMSANYENKVDSIANPDVYFGENPTFGWMLEDGTMVGGVTQILQMASKIYEYTDEDTNETCMRVNGSVINVKDQNLMRDFVGVSYMKVTIPATEAGAEDTVQYKMATLQEDRARTIVYVAQKAADDNKYESSKTVLENYVNDYIDYYKTQNEGAVPTVNYTVDVYDHDTYVKTLSGEEYTAFLNETVTYEIPSEDVEYFDQTKSVVTARALANDKTSLKVVYNKTHTPVKYEKASNAAKEICGCGYEKVITLKEYDSAMLKFETQSSKNMFGIISSLISQNVEDGNAVVKVSNFGGVNTSNGVSSDKATSSFRLNLSGAYKLGEIARIDIKVKQNVNGTPDANGVLNSSDFLRVWANREEYTQPIIDSGVAVTSSEWNNKLKAVQLTSFQASALPTTEYKTISISAQNISAIYAETGFTAETPLNVLSMAYTDGSNGRIANLLIDEIKIVTKADIAQEMNTIYEFNDASCLDLMSFGASSASTVKAGVTWADGKINNVKIGTTSGCYCYANISLGGIFKVADLESITINLETASNTATNSDYIDVLLNHSSFNSNGSTANRPTSGTSRVSFTRAPGKISVTLTKEGILKNTAFTSDTTIEMLSLSLASGGKAALTFSIDSIVFNFAK